MGEGMSLKPDQLQKVQNWFRSHPLQPCPACGESEWAFGEIVTAPLISQPVRAPVREVVPVLQVFCGHCAHVMHFGAIRIGLVTLTEAMHNGIPILSTDDEGVVQ